ncbi:iron-sulfur cluster assembly scaffold protein [Alcaligenes sp. SDU_A2]|uniref:iron-sulfur cluster assembly scaffold protein n=1 Tax=Alcaligenes sp. SDU_A2 TaxID=3136634 RepID=UPI00311FB02F
MQYNNTVMDHFMHPRHVGVMESSDADVGTGLAGSRELGAIIQIQVRVAQNGLIQNACFKAYGCGCTIAAASLAAQWLQGRSLEQAGDFSQAYVQQELDLPAIKVHCALLALEAVQAALAQAQNKLAAQRSQLVG